MDGRQSPLQRLIYMTEEWAFVGLVLVQLPETNILPKSKYIEGLKGERTSVLTAFWRIGGGSAVGHGCLPFLLVVLLDEFRVGVENIGLADANDKQKIKMGKASNYLCGSKICPKGVSAVPADEKVFSSRNAWGTIVKGGSWRRSPQGLPQKAG